MYLLMFLVYLFILKMSSQKYFFTFCSGYCYGLLLLDICLCFPVAKTDRNYSKLFQNQAFDSATEMETKYGSSEHKLLSLMDITSFIDKHSVVFNSNSSENRSALRIKRSAATNVDGNGMDPLNESFSVNIDAGLTENSLRSNDNVTDSPRQPTQFEVEPEVFISSSNKSTTSEPRILSSSSKQDPSGSEYALTTARPNHDTPQYMLDLFARFQNDPFNQPASNTVRSFFNEATPDDQSSYDAAYTECIKERGFDHCPRVHHLIFDVTSVPDHEHVTMAELRLYKFVERDRRRYVGMDRKVEVVELIRSDQTEVDINDTNPISRRIILDSRRIIGRRSGWETFFITQAIRRWLKSGYSAIHELEIYIENISGSSTKNSLDFEQSPMTTNEPLLVVFSDDTSKHHRLEHREELEELLSHGNNEENLDPPVGIPKEDFFRRQKPNHERIIEDDEMIQRKKRSAYNPCHLERMYVDFEEIGYDSWIINPKGYAAGHCVGSCDFPFHRLSVSPHGVIQSQMHHQYDSQFEKPCCVPTKLGPISLLYLEKNSLTYKHNYEGMQVLGCGCR